MTSKHVPAQLIIGPKELAIAYGENVIQKAFCASQKPECFCHECRKIKHRQHPSLVWISPAKDYTIDDIEIVFERSRFALDEGQQFFFVFDNVHTLTAATANRLLKVLEEPPAGYNFLLLTHNSHAVLPTIISRCLLVQLTSVQAGTTFSDPLLDYFMVSSKRSDPLGFESELKKQNFTDSTSVERVHDLIALLIEKTRNGQPDSYDNQVLRFLTDALRKPPQSGSSDLFWKHLFLNFPRHEDNS